MSKRQTINAERAAKLAETMTQREVGKLLAWEDGRSIAYTYEAVGAAIAKRRKALAAQAEISARSSGVE